MELWGLFISAFVSSTLAPGGSEVVLAYLVTNSAISYYWLGIVATIGNTLGALTTFLLGYFPAHRISARYAEKLHNPRAIGLLHRWGMYTLLFSWLPLIGDAFCFAAGWLRLPVLRATAFIITGKALRYSVLIYYLV